MSMLGADDRPNAIFDLPMLPELLRAFEVELRKGADQLDREVDLWLEGPAAVASPEARTQVESTQPHLGDLVRSTQQVRAMAESILDRPPSLDWQAGPRLGTHHEILVDVDALDDLCDRMGVAPLPVALAQAKDRAAGPGSMWWRVDFPIDSVSAATAASFAEIHFPMPDHPGVEPEPGAVGLLNTRERLRAAGARISLDRPRQPTRLQLELRSRPAR